MVVTGGHGQSRAHQYTKPTPAYIALNNPLHLPIAHVQMSLDYSLAVPHQCHSITCSYIYNNKI